jgi:hypothetical protein
VLVLDRQVMTGEILPALASHHFRETSDDIRYQLAVVEEPAASPCISRRREFTPGAGAKTDASADLFQVRPQEFPQMAADVRRFTALALPAGAAGTQTMTTFSMPGRARRRGQRRQGGGGDRAGIGVSTVVARAGQNRDRAWVTALAGTAPAAAKCWLLVKHPCRVARGGHRQRPPPEPAGQHEYPRRARGEHAADGRLDAAFTGTGAAADGNSSPPCPTNCGRRSPSFARPATTSRWLSSGTTIKSGNTASWYAAKAAG